MNCYSGFRGTHSFIRIPFHGNSVLRVPVSPSMSDLDLVFLSPDLSFSTKIYASMSMQYLENLSEESTLPLKQLKVGQNIIVFKWFQKKTKWN